MAKILVEVPKEEEGLESLIGSTVTLFCTNYFYTGFLVGVNDRWVKLEDASIVYETGSFGEANWKDAQRLHRENGKHWYVQTASIESFGILK